MQKKQVPILDSDTVVNPRAVVVKHLHTLVALSAVLSSDRSYSLASVTDVVHWVVDVVEVTPGSWITNLNKTRKKKR